jgi:hypothetical protein
MTISEKDWVLGLPKEMKLMLLEDSLKEDEFGVFLNLSKVLLDAPLSEGGISTEEIEEIRIKNQHSKFKI